MTNKIKSENKHQWGYSLHSSRGAGYFTDMAPVLDTETYIPDMVLIKCSSPKEAESNALQYLHSIQPNLKNSFHLSPNWFQYLTHLQQDDLDSKTSGVVAWDRTGE